MIVARSKTCSRVLLAAVLVTASVFACSAQAVAATPWWRLSTISAPAEKTGGKSEVIVEATNLGDKVADGRFSPMTVTDTLPSGVTPTAVYGEGGGGASGWREEKRETESSLGGPNCKIADQTVTCVYLWPLMPYERLSVAIAVNVTSGSGDGLNKASVSGGGAAPVVVQRGLALEGPQSFGVQNYEIAPEEEGGALDTQAGSHPFQLTTTFALSPHTTPIVSPTGEPRLEALPDALAKDLSFKLPAGLIGNPAAIKKCKTSVFTQEASRTSAVKCPDDTVVGVATSIVNTLTVNGTPNVPGTVTAPIYNLEPSAGEPARFGFDTPTVVGVVLDTSVRTGGDYGVTVTVPDITQLVAFVGSQVTFWGAPSDPRHDTQRGTKCLAGTAAERYVETGQETSCPLSEQEQPFLIMPTSCQEPAQTTVEGDSWSEPGVFSGKGYTFQNDKEDPFRFDGCDRLSFEPSIAVAPDVQQASSPTGLKVDVHVPQDASLNPTGLAESAVKRIAVALPEGVMLNPSGANNLEACPESLVGFTGFGEFEGGGKTATFTPFLPGSIAAKKAVEEHVALESEGLLEPGLNFCVDASKIATVEIHSPLLPVNQPLKGAVYLASQSANPFGSLIAMYLVAEDPVSGTLVKLAGEVKLSATGQITTTFTSPPLPFEDAKLEFFGGSRAPLGTPALCGSYTTTASFTPWSGNPAADVSAAPFDITTGPDGTQATCHGPLPFSPTLATGTSNLQAGAFTPFTMTMSREDGNQNLDSIQLKIPAGLSGLLTGVELCPEPQASQGLCSPNSLIGETTVSVGLGGSPYTVKGGKVYITGPYEGAPFGLSIVNPAKAGPFDLEKGKNACDCVLVRAKIQVDPLTAALTVTSDPPGSPYSIPTTIDGIPLQIKHVNVTIDRPGFTFNPTDCEKTAITGALTSSEGATSSLSVPFQVTNCATLGFKPSFTVSTSAKTSRRNGASLKVKLAYPSAPFGTQANIHYVKVDLPRQLPSRLPTLQKACPHQTFEANPAACPGASIVGYAKATTPLLPVQLEGPAYFVSYGGAKFPELVVVLQGYGITLDLHGETFINEKTNVTSSTFKTVPDAPVGTFELTLPEGQYSALAANTNLCNVSGGLKMPTRFVAQNGAEVKQSTPISVTGCKPAIHVVGRSVKGARASIRVAIPSAGTLVASGSYVVRSVKRATKAGTVTIGVSLTSRGMRVLAKNPHQRVNAKVKLSFRRKHGAPLTAYVRLLMG